jgi:hypothetical protein
VVVVELAAGVLVAILSDLLLKINYLKGGIRKNRLFLLKEARIKIVLLELTRAANNQLEGHYS